MEVLNTKNGKKSSFSSQSVKGGQAKRNPQNAERGTALKRRRSHPETQHLDWPLVPGITLN